MADPDPTPRHRPIGLTRPGGAVVLGLAGAVLIALESSWEALFGGLVGSSPGVGWGLSTQVLGGVGLAEATGLGLASILAYAWPRSHTTLGIAMISLSLLGLYSGGGLILGTLLGYVGGLLGIAFRPAPRGSRLGGLNSDEAFDDPVVEAELVDEGSLVAGSTDARERTPASSQGG